MTASLLLTKLRAEGLQLRVAGEVLFVKPKASITFVQRQAIAESKPQLITLLSKEEVDWPVECIKSEQKYGHCAARLYPLIGKVVETPRGVGLLWQVFANRAGVLMDGNRKWLLFITPEDIKPR